MSPLVLALALAAPPDTPADPIKHFEAELRNHFVSEENLATSPRKAKLLKAAAALKTPGELIRALAIQRGWQHADLVPAVADIDQTVRKELIDRVAKELRVGFAGDADRQRAALGVAAGLFGIRDATDELADDLAALAAKAEDAAVRRDALRLSGSLWLDLEKTGPAFEAALKSEAVEDRRAAAAGLAALVPNSRGVLVSGRWVAAGDPGPTYLPLLRQAIADPDAGVRRPCLAVLRERARWIGNSLASVRREENPGIPVDTPAPPVDRDGPAGYEPFLPVLAKLATDTAPDNALPALSTLEAVADLRAEWILAGKIAPDAALDKAVLPAVVKQLAHKDVRIRLGAIYVLEALGPTAGPAADNLIAMLEDENQFARWGAVRALGRAAPAGGRKAIVALANHLADDSPEVRDTVPAALARFGKDAAPAVPALGAALKDADAASRSRILRVLASLGPASAPASAAVRACLSDPNAFVRLDAVTMLATLGKPDTETKAALRKALDDADPAVRSAAGDVLLRGE